MKGYLRPRPHVRARDALRSHWVEVDRNGTNPPAAAAEVPAILNSAEPVRAQLAGGGTTTLTDPVSSTFRARWRLWLLGLPKRLNDADVKDRMYAHIESKFAAVEPADAERTDSAGGRAHRRQADTYLRNINLAAAWEGIFKLVMAAVVVASGILVVTAFQAGFDSASQALLVGLAVVLLIILPRPPSSDSLRSVLGKIVFLIVTAFVVYYAWGNIDQFGLPAEVRIFAAAVLPVVKWISIAAVSVMTLLLVLRLTRDEFVDRVFMRCAQQSLVIELIGAAQMLESQAQGVEWGPDSVAWGVLERLDTARQLVDRHEWYPKLRTAEKKRVVPTMRQISTSIRELRHDLLCPKEGTVRELRDKALNIASVVNCGYFGELSLPATEESPGIVARLRASLGRLLCDLPLALTPFGAIWLFDQIGFDSPGNQVLRGGLMWSGVSFAIYVAFRALDPSMAGKVTLFSRFRSILRISTTASSKHSASGWWHGLVTGRLVASGGVRVVLIVQVGAGRSGIQGRPMSASRSTVIVLWPCFAAVDRQPRMV